MLRLMICGLLAVVGVVAGETVKQSKTHEQWQSWEPREQWRDTEVEQMATTRWTGALSGDWATAGNWSNGVPATGDTVIIPRTSSRSITTGLDRTGDGAGAGLNLVLLSIEEGYNGDIGSSGNYLKCTADKIKVRHGGEFWFTSDSGTAGLTTDLVVLDGVGDYYITNTDTQNVVRFDILQGNWTITFANCGGSATTLYVLGGSGTLNMSNIGGSTVWQTGGSINCVAETIAMTHHMREGSFAISGTVTNNIVLYQTGGSWYLDAIGGAPQYYILGGLFDATRKVGARTAVVFVYSPNAEVLLDADFDFITGKILIGS